MFECSDFGAPTNGSAQLNSWVVVDPDLNCFEHEHVLWMVFAGIIIAIYGAVSIDTFLAAAKGVIF